MKDNFKTIGKIKFSLLDYLILISPFLLPFIFLGGKDEIGVTKHPYSYWLKGLLFFIPIIIYVSHLGKGFEIKTGKTFRSKGGTEFEEYQKIYEPDKKISDNLRLIIKIHLISGILVLLCSRISE